MGIKVKLQDADVEVGGQFNSALIWIKSFEGRRFDGTTKTWTIPTDLKTFTAHCAFPLDIHGAANHAYSGAHITAYGNRYDRDEWDAMKEGDEAVRQADYTAVRQQQAALNQELKQRIAALGLTGTTATKIEVYIRDSVLEEMEEAGKIKLSSSERRAAFVAIADWYDTESLRLMDAERDIEEAAREQVLRKYF